MRILTQSTAYSLMVFMTDSSDPTAGKTGLTLTITASKAGAAFASISPTVTEAANGWYSLALTTTHTNTLGDLALHITGTGADATDLVAQVVAVNLADATALGLSRLDAAITSRMATYSQPTGFLAATFPATVGDATAANQTTLLAGVNVTEVGGNAVLPAQSDGSIVSYVTTAGITSQSFEASAITAIQSGLATSSALATVATYVDTEVAAIKAKTDNLPSDPADASDIAASFTKLRKYLQLLARKDAAIATDNAAELAELNANGGSGAGAFANTTDSTESLRDRGDAAWTTGGASGTSLATGTIASTTGTTTTLDSGALANADFYIGAKLLTTSGTGANQERIITAYSVSRVATHAAWDVNPDNTTTYAILPARTPIIQVNVTAS